MKTRLERLRAALQEQQREALLITAPSNRRYISGFSGSAGALLVTDSAALLFTDFRYRIRAEQEAPAFELRQISAEEPLHRVVSQTAAELGLQQIAFEDQHLTVAQHAKLAQAFDEMAAAERPDLVPLENGLLVEPLREVKQAEELAALCRAISITDAAFEAVLPTLTPQHTERQAAWLLECAMRERGADGVSFPVIVAAGRNAAKPHAEPDDTPLGNGQPIIIDMGARYQGYHADLTRTIVLGEPDERFQQIYHIVLEAQQRAIAGLRAGMTGAEGDALARDHIAAAGYGEAFGHSLGHGVGLDIHEGPVLRRTSEQTLQAGSVFSVEPGVYLEEWGGVRIEDLALLREDGCEVLSRAPKR